jgi:hypothetical protein
MKKLFFLSAAVPLALLFSFTFQQKGFKKIGTNLYSVTSVKTIAKGDQEELKQIITEHYGIKDFTKDVIIGPGNPIYAKSNWILHKSIVIHVLSESLIKYDKQAKLETPEDVKKIQTIIAKYGAK